MIRKGRVNRAAQFLPFDAMKGLSEELQMREEKLSRVAKKELSEDDAEAINDVINKIDYGSQVEIVYYDQGHYYDIICVVEKKDIVYRYLSVAAQKIYFDDIYSIKIVET